MTTLIRTALAAALALASTPGVAHAAPGDGPAVGRRSGLPFDSGVFAHDAVATAGHLGRVGDYEQVTGRHVDVWQIAPYRDDGIDALITETDRIAGLVPDGVRVDWATPLMTREQAARFGAAACKAGPDPYFRPGWEFNLKGAWPWTTDRVGVDAYVRGFRATIDGARSTCPGLKATWNVNTGQGGVEEAMKAWPGSDYVDLIGVDAYDWSGEDPLNGDGQLEDWAAKARELGKGITLPEWGVHGTKGRGDNPQFVRDVLAWADRNRDLVRMMSYFDEDADYITNSVGEGQMPKTGAALKAGFTALAGAAPEQQSAAPTPAPDPTPGVHPGPLVPQRVTPGRPPVVILPLPETLQPFQPGTQGPPFPTYELMWGPDGWQIKESTPSPTTTS